MAAVLGGAQSIFTCAMDEAYQIPTEQSAETALRTQQVIAHESGIASTVDPLGGSHYVEYLTDAMEAEILKVIEEIEAYGGVAKAIEDGYLQTRIARRAHQRKAKVDRGETVVVGVNRFRREDQEDGLGEAFTLDPESARQVIEKYERVLESRDGGAAARALDRLQAAAAEPSAELMPRLIECCHAYATVGEMVARLKREWGEFREPVGL